MLAIVPSVALSLSLWLLSLSLEPTAEQTCSSFSVQTIPKSRQTSHWERTASPGSQSCLSCRTGKRSRPPPWVSGEPQGGSCPALTLSRSPWLTSSRSSLLPAPGPLGRRRPGRGGPSCRPMAGPLPLEYDALSSSSWEDFPGVQPFPAEELQVPEVQACPLAVFQQSSCPGEGAGWDTRVQQHVWSWTGVYVVCVCVHTCVCQWSRARSSRSGHPLPARPRRARKDAAAAPPGAW